VVFDRDERLDAYSRPGVFAAGALIKIQKHFGGFGVFGGGIFGVVGGGIFGVFGGGTFCVFGVVGALLISLEVVSAAFGGARQASRKVTVDDLMKLRTIVDAKISPDGRRVAYVVSQPSVERNAHETELFVVAATGGASTRLPLPVRIFTPALPAPRLRWSHDSRTISFLGIADARQQVYAISAEGGAAERITNAPQGVIAYEWAPDGKRVAYLAREAAEPSVVIRVHAPPPSTRLWAQTSNGAATALTPPAHYVDSFTWAPDAASLVYSAAPTTSFTSGYYTRLYRVAALGGEPRVLVDRAGMNTAPQFSPDGTRIAFVTTNERLGLIAPRGLAIVDVRSGGPSGAPTIRAYPMNGAWIGEMRWAPDSRSLFVLVNEGTFATGEHMFELPVVRVSIDSGDAQRVVPGAVVNYSISVSGDGRTLAYRQVEPRTMGDIVVRDLASGRTTTVTNVNPELSRFALGGLKPIKWRSFDGMDIWGLLITPPGASETRKLPLIVYCHGGPIGGVTYGVFPQFMHTVGQVDPYPVEALVSAGYAVLFPMPRGGSGYGEAGHRAIINSWGDADYRDIMAGVDHVVAEGIADPDRLGVMGASYGGFMTNWIVTQTNRFKAASSSASISDLTDLYYLADSGLVMEEYFKKPWENRESYAAHSPITFVERVSTPLLLQHGENDPRVPLASGRKFYEALKALGKTVEFDIFPRGGHVQYQPVAQHESMRRNFEWFTTRIPTQ
jgi:dipeptidyl aminopeptidase/acylaminoacyl peptidase